MTTSTDRAGSRRGTAAPGTGQQVLRHRMKPGRWARELGWRHVVGVLAVLYAVFPIVYVVSASLSPTGTLTGSNELFAQVSGVNYAELGDTKFWTWMGNTLVIGVATAVGTVLMGAAAAYAFSRFRFAGRRLGLTSLLEANWGLFAAGAVLSAIPVLALFLFLQKYIVGGLTAGSVKG